MKKTLTLMIICCLLAVATVFCFAGCNTEQDTIRLIEVTHSVFYAPLYVAIDGGYFEEEGIKVELSNGGGADKCMTAVLSGQADIGFHGPEAVIYVAEEKDKDYPIMFGQLTEKDGSFLMAREPMPDFKWSDMAGKEVIGGRRGGVPAMALEHAMLLNGLTDGVNVTINYDVQYDLIGAAFISGTGDFCTMFEPAASEMQAQGTGYIVASVGEAAGDMPFTAFSAKQSYIDENPDKIQAFCNAIARAIEYVYNTDSEEIARLISPSFAGSDIATLANAIQAYKDIGAYSPTLVPDAEDFDRLQDVIIEAGVIDSKIDFDKIVDLSFAEKATEYARSLA